MTEVLRTGIGTMVGVLVRPPHRFTEEPPAGTRVGAMRAALRRGPQSSRDLAAAAGVTTALVVPLLKSDLACGRVERFGRLYRLSDCWDADLQARLADAQTLLKRHGYQVTKASAAPVFADVEAA